MAVPRYRFSSWLVTTFAISYIQRAAYPVTNSGHYFPLAYIPTLVTINKSFFIAYVPDFCPCQNS